MKKTLIALALGLGFGLSLRAQSTDAPPVLNFTTNVYSMVRTNTQATLSLTPDQMSAIIGLVQSNGIAVSGVPITTTNLAVVVVNHVTQDTNDFFLVSLRLR